MKKVASNWIEDSYELLGFGNDVMLIESYVRNNPTIKLNPPICEVWNAEHEKPWYARIYASETLQGVKFKSKEEAMNAVDRHLEDIGYRFISDKSIILL